MSLAQRVREFRYSKGWGPDELASRAEISRTALYQIESGKTELPRAGTLRRIAVALDVPMEELLGGGAEPDATVSASSRPLGSRPSRGTFGWIPTDEGPMRTRVASSFTGVNPPVDEDSRVGAEAFVKPRSIGPDTPFAREGELMAKLHDLIHSPFGECITSVVDDLHRMLGQVRASG
jgi:transcriptional regulator with XRE-family HTH domain